MINCRNGIDGYRVAHGTALRQMSHLTKLYISLTGQSNPFTAGSPPCHDFDEH